MSQNTNHLVPPEAGADAIREALEERRYEGYPMGAGLPELSPSSSRTSGAERPHVPPAGGGTEALYMLTRALLARRGRGPRKRPELPDHPQVHRARRGPPGPRHLRAAVPAHRRPVRPRRSAPKTKMILLIDPLNPLGSGYPEEEVRAIAELAKDHHLWLLNDITYRDFADRHDARLPVPPGEDPHGLVGLEELRARRPADRRPRGRAGAREDREPVQHERPRGQHPRPGGGDSPTFGRSRRGSRAVRATTRQNQATIRDAVAGTPGNEPAGVPVASEHVRDRHRGDRDLARGAPGDPAARDGVFVRAGNYLSPKFGGASCGRRSPTRPPTSSGSSRRSRAPWRRCVRRGRRRRPTGRGGVARDRAKIDDRVTRPGP